jgi:hypothetical protein
MIKDTDQYRTNKATKTIRALKFITSPTQIYCGGEGGEDKQADKFTVGDDSRTQCISV